ncbi:MAG: hypothetical protein WC313_02060 [Candidatus Kapaibacterium sp.]|jgi:hypothetical protein|nr:hypothetical protein [Candidatus Kapabacteria bacterium]
MSYERLIHDYLDGELNQTDEAELFSVLSVSPDLRSEFNRQVKLISLVAADVQKTTVPSDLTGAIFNRLGIAPPIPSAIVHKTDKANGNFKWYAGILVLLLIFTTGTSLYFLSENFSLKNKNDGKASNNVAIIESYSDYSVEKSSESNQGQNDEISDSEQSSHSSITGKNKHIDDYRINGGYTANRTFSGENSFGTDSQSKVSGHSDYINVSQSMIHNASNSLDGRSNSMNAVNRDKVKIASFQVNGGFIYNAGEIAELNNNKFSIQLRRMSSISSYPPNVINNEDNFLSDNTIGAMYRINNDFSLGIEVGNERYPQEFSYNNLNYTQTPEIYWYGVALRWQPQEFLIPYKLNVYVNLTTAYSSVGTVIKPHVGFIYNITSHVSIFTGLESSNLIYTVGGDIYNSRKLGITGGLNINIK